MPTRRPPRTTTPRSTAVSRSSAASQAGTTRRRTRGGLRTAAAALPLALGLMSTQLPSGQPPSTTPPGVATHQISVSKGTFSPVCTLPYKGVKNPDSDDHCGIQGGSNDPAKQAESRSKNDLCAAHQPPETLVYQQLIDLQRQVAAAGINARQLTDRTPLNNIAEGKYVNYIAFIQEAHYSDVAKGEAVNCNIPGNTTNDIHIVLVQHPTDDPCTSTTAEMIPHFRPEAWTPENLMAVRQHPVRVQGHLFYDGSHTPCSGSSRPNPQRASLWEIHPVYELDVCKLTDIDACRSSTNTADWVPLEDFLSSESGGE